MAVKRANQVGAVQQDESYFVSMTDIMIGLLFIFLILLTYFAYQLQEDTVPRIQYEELEAQRDALVADLEDLKAQLEQMELERDRLLARIAELEREISRLKSELERLRLQRQDAVDELTKYLGLVESSRSRILDEIEERLELAGIDVIVIHDQGIIRLPEGVLFGVGEFDIQPGSVAYENVTRLARALYAVLPCFTLLEVRPTNFDQCNPDQAFVEAVFIEGHTDTTPIGPGGLREAPELSNNLRLSARRATNAYSEIVRVEAKLAALVNPDSEQIFAAAAFGESRPAYGNDRQEDRARNRRIDIRILMFSPVTLEALRSLQDRIDRQYAD